MLAMVFAVMTGCAKGEVAQSPSNEAPKDNQQTPAKPITLKLFYWSQLNDEMQQRLVVEPIKKKFPNITLEFSNRTTGSSTDVAASLSTGGNEVDIMAIQSGPILNVFKTYKLLEDLTPLIKKSKLFTTKVAVMGQIVAAIKTMCNKSRGIGPVICGNQNYLRSKWQRCEPVRGINVGLN
jgi:multiple sugar transport system substrate-binding protein